MTSASNPGDDQGAPGALSAMDAERRMIELSILRSGRYYYYAGYRYDRLADAIAYAEVVRARRERQLDPPWLMPSVMPPVDSGSLPNRDDRKLMSEFGISFSDGRFTLSGFHYDRLADAVNYARHLREATPDTD